MTILKKRLAGPAQVTNSAATKYTVPAATTTVVRHVHVYNADTVACTFTMSIGSDAAGTRVFDAYSMAAGSFLDHFCYYVLTATEIIQALAGTTNKLTLTIDGEEITLG